jgi:hypothetical protein
MNQEIQKQIGEIVLPAFQKIKTDLRAKGRFAEIQAIPFDEKATLEVTNKGRFEFKYILTVSKNQKGQFIGSAMVEFLDMRDGLGQRYQSTATGPDELTIKSIVVNFYKEYKPMKDN